MDRTDKHSRSRNRNAGLRRCTVLGWLHLMRISNRMVQAATSQLNAWELSNAQFDILTQVGGAEGILQVNLARRLYVTQGNITQVLDKMEERGFIQRIREGRAKRLYLTAVGRQLYDEVVPRHQDFVHAQFEHLTDEEQRQLLRLLAKLDRAQR